ncbi:MAG: exodeoxyribonuclease VII small subunit [Pseudomonadota bacterium]
MANKKDQPLKEGQSADFEKNLTSLEQIVKDLESGKLSLEDGLSKFESGVELYKKCKDFLSQAEKKIKLLTEDLKEEGLSMQSSDAENENN